MLDRWADDLKRAERRERAVPADGFCSETPPRWLLDTAQKGLSVSGARAGDRYGGERNDRRAIARV